VEPNRRLERGPGRRGRRALEREGRGGEGLGWGRRRITHRAEECDWRTASAKTRERALAAWRAWWTEHNGEPREVWVAKGFEAIGVAGANAEDVRAIDPMLAALPAAPDHLVYNINRSLREITGRWAPLEQESGVKLEAYWSKWWAKNKARLITRDS